MFPEDRRPSLPVQPASSLDTPALTPNKPAPYSFPPRSSPQSAPAESPATERGRRPSEECHSAFSPHSPPDDNRPRPRTPIPVATPATARPSSSQSPTLPSAR